MNATERAQAKLIGEEVMRLRARVALLEGLLRSVEWCGVLASTVTGLPPAHCCLFCYRTTTEGHAPDCRYVAALADGG